MTAVPLLILPGPEEGARFWVEVLLWGLPCAGAVCLFFAARRGGRATWSLVASACAAIVLDKIVDVQIVVHSLGQTIVGWIDPGKSMRDDHVWMRLLLLGGLVVAGCATLLIWTRKDRERSRAKRVALAGLAAVLVYLGARLVPALKGPLAPPVGWIVEGLCWALVAAGEVLAWRSRSPSSPVS